MAPQPSAKVRSRQLKKDAKRLADVSVQEPGSSSHQSRELMKKLSPHHRPKYPRLPKDYIKVVIRPREGLNVAQESDAQLRDSILTSAGFP
ncbi:hypothetical protein HPB48_006664 [Haemaphysalis longicornis]|uniref:Uncharacterized protein n=1 Tax=Haemaphysalis longicornis TaxID=44386 RepID=A0A9J6FBD6_HAELO|nr:hypothetical protein HPB48_006664 [Haemaphysalis longicornis]